MFNYFKFVDFNKKENANKFILVGALLLVLGTISLLFRNVGITLVSFSIGLICLVLAYFNLKTINELRRYETKTVIRPYIIRQSMLIIAALIFFIFPQQIQGLLSSIAGAFLVVNQILTLISSRKNPYKSFTVFNGFLLVVGLALILSPLFLSSFIASFIAFILIMIGFSLLSTGNKLKRM